MITLRVNILIKLLLSQSNIAKVLPMYQAQSQPFIQKKFVL
jgi:hypothetical protein